MAAMNSFKTSDFSPSEMESISLWRMPDINGKQEATGADSDQDADAAPLSVLTVDEIEAMQKQAYDEAFAQGRQDGYDEGFNKGFGEGSAQGHEAAEQVLRDRAAVFAGLLDSLSQPFKDLDAEVERELVKLTIAIATQIIRRELKLEPGQVVAAVREAINVLPLSAQKISLSLHPEDAGLVRSALSLDEMSPAWRIVEDPLMTRGGCKVDTEVSHIDATVENHLAAVIATLFGGEREEDKKP